MKKVDFLFGWIYHHKDFVDKVQSENDYFFNIYISATTVKDTYAGLKSYIKYLKDGIKHYKEVGLYEGRYFEYYIAYDDNIKSFENRLKYIEENMDFLLKEERKKELENKARPTIKNELLNIITNNPGILQKDIYKEFDPLLKDFIGSTLYSMSDDKKIIREKSGNSYKLYIKQKKRWLFF